MRRGWTIPEVVRHTYYQLKTLYASDLEHERRRGFDAAVSARMAQADKDSWQKYCKGFE